MLLTCLTIAAILGSLTGYLTGKYFGQTIENRKESWFFKKSHIETTRKYFNKYFEIIEIIQIFDDYCEYYLNSIIKMAGKLNLDKLDLQIIHYMMENAEISYADLGKKLFVSGGTIHVRIKKLQEAGVVKGTRLKADLKQLGYDVIAFIGIYLKESSLYDAVAKDLQKIPEIVRLNYTTG